jgi:hypothetical protein
MLIHELICILLLDYKCILSRYDIKTQDLHDWKSMLQESRFYEFYPERVHLYFYMYGLKTKIFHLRT